VDISWSKPQELNRVFPVCNAPVGDSTDVCCIDADGHTCAKASLERCDARASSKPVRAICAETFKLIRGSITTPIYMPLEGKRNYKEER
jgi:hypothetical protein